MIKLFLKEYLDEMSTVCRDNQNNVSIAVNPDSERQGHPYFKFYNNVYYGDAAKGLEFYLIQQIMLIIKMQKTKSFGNFRIKKKSCLKNF